MERIKIISTVIIFLFMGLLITSCKDASENANNLMYGNEKLALTDRINNTINRIDAKIGELENRLDKATEETTEKINEQLDKLKERREELRADLRESNDKSDDTWEKFKADVDEVIDDTEAWINNIDIDFNKDAETINKK